MPIKDSHIDLVSAGKGDCAKSLTEKVGFEGECEENKKWCHAVPSTSDNKQGNAVNQKE